MVGNMAEESELGSWEGATRLPVGLSLSPQKGHRSLQAWYGRYFVQTL